MPFRNRFKGTLGEGGGGGLGVKRYTQFRASVFEETPKHVLKNGKMNPFRGTFILDRTFSAVIFYVR